MSGKVYLTGAGPGDPELLTVKARRAIRQADVILYDNLVNPEILEEVKEDAILIYVGKEDKHHTIPQEQINAMLVEYAQKYAQVVRLKGGDPLVFGRGGEEALFLAENNIEFEFIPGITSAIAVPAYAGIPVTHRGINTSFRVMTGHQAACHKCGKDHGFDAGTLRENETLVILMGLHGLDKIIPALVKNGVLPTTPCAVIENGTRKNQRCVTATLETIIEASQGMGSPAIIVIGETVLLRNQLQWFDKKETL
jgi:uroporphyrin-III C-methyltransferase